MKAGLRYKNVLVCSWLAVCICIVTGRALVVLHWCNDSSRQVDLLICIRTHKKSVNCCHHIYNKIIVLLSLRMLSVSLCLV